MINKLSGQVIEVGSSCLMVLFIILKMFSGKTLVVSIHQIAQFSKSNECKTLSSSSD